MKKLFGTDGIRGVAGQSPLTNKEVSRLGHIAGAILNEKFPQSKCRVVVVRDTRDSGRSLLDALKNGLLKMGVDVYDAGVLSTPSVAYLVKAHQFESGVVISASHNPPQFNGIKFFTNHGYKWPDSWETSIEERWERPFKKKSSRTKGNLIPAHGFEQDYEHFLISTFGQRPDFSGIKIALDCANGSSHNVGPRLLARLGARVYPMGIQPNGKNINVGCGSQHPEKLVRLVQKKKCDLGIAFDGDADRVIFVDEKGNLIDGDYVLGMLSKYWHKNKLLRNKTAVITVMANLGLKKALTKIGVRSIETPVGDRHVSEAMRKHDAVLGGEQSGHIILGDYLPSGDGLLTALHIVRIFKEGGKAFSQLVSWMRKYPQVLLNVPVKEKHPLEKLLSVQSKIRATERHLGDNGRVLVRYSGTEPLLRIMLEGPDDKELNHFAEEIAGEVKKACC